MDLIAATATPNPTDSFSLLPLFGNAPAASTDSSASLAQNFSAILTELTGPLNTEPGPSTHCEAVTADAVGSPAANAVGSLAANAVASPAANAVASPAASAAASLAANAVAKSGANPAASPGANPVANPAVNPTASLPADPSPVETAPTPELQPVAELPLELPPTIVNLAQFVTADPKTREPQKADRSAATDNAAAISVTSFPFVPVAAATTAFTNSTSAVDKPAKVGDPNTSVPEVVIPPSLPQPELERAFADVKRFEFTVQPQTGRQAVSGQRQQPQSLSAPSEPAEFTITTDAITNVQQQQLPLRVIAVQRLIADTKPVDRNKPDVSTSSTDSTATTPTAQTTDLIRPVERMDQVLAAHHVEIPNMPHLAVVRTVSMEVGDADSQVTIRIQERGGDISMLLNAGSDSLQQDLQSAAGSLAHALKQEQVQVSTIEVSRKSPIDKVRRMKEAR